MLTVETIFKKDLCHCILHQLPHLIHRTADSQISERDLQEVLCRRLCQFCADACFAGDLLCLVEQQLSHIVFGNPVEIHHLRQPSCQFLLHAAVNDVL